MLRLNKQCTANCGFYCAIIFLCNGIMLQSILGNIYILGICTKPNNIKQRLRFFKFKYLFVPSLHSYNRTLPFNKQSKYGTYLLDYAC